MEDNPPQLVESGDLTSVTDAPGEPALPGEPPVRRLVAALLATARRPSRATFARWMVIVEPTWVAPLLAVVVALDMLSGIMATLANPFIQRSVSQTAYYRFGLPMATDRLLYALVFFPLIELIEFALLMFAVGALLPVEQGTLKKRAFQVARPYLLALIINGVVTLLLLQPLDALGRIGLGQESPLGLIPICLSLPVAIYLIPVYLNALAAGSGRSRWLLVGVASLAYLATYLFVWYGLGVILYRFGIHMAVPF
jgi:hypothetical protein